MKRKLSRRIGFIGAFLFSILFEVLLVLSLLFSTGVHSRELDRSYFEWQRDPTPEKEQAWREQRERVATIEYAINGFLVFLASGNLFVIRFTFRKAFVEERSSHFIPQGGEMQ